MTRLVILIILPDNYTSTFRHTVLFGHYRDMDFAVVVTALIIIHKIFTKAMLSRKILKELY